ncbi:MAG TPA: lipase maturation factor family protein [Vicinamibacterales bacterium]|nr:lipase maturation factor family protein [Vicinamibacterales bacterium]
MSSTVARRSRAATYSAASWVFLRLLGVAYLIAFWSLAQQVPGLIGHDGVLPAKDFLSDVRAWADTIGPGLDRYRLAPTLFWLGTSDAALQGVAYGGAALSLLLIAGLAPAIVLPLLWIGYLSLSVVCGDFLSFQWDSLLLETGLLATCVAPFAWRDRLRDATDPPAIARWLVWWLLFRLMLGSGAVKLASGDPTWRDLTALAVHYETQPIPTPIAWYADLLPLWIQRFSTAMVLVVELAVPLLIVAGRRPRRLAAVIFIGLQLLIAVTGNYAFFNLLTIALCVMLLDDRTPVIQRLASPSPVAAVSGRRWLPVVVAIVTVPVSVSILAGQLGFGRPGAVRALADGIDPLRSVNGYGLFAVMTTTRPEIVVEGSMDGSTWKAYEFFDKPGDLSRRPPWVAPFQPRLDWQMWFAALGRFEDEHWFQRFCARLLEGSPAVTKLLASNPFPDAPPRFVRATLYRYRFTDWSAGRSTGDWWTRERLGEYAPVLSRARSE